ncbi:MAG: 23S rRNA (adenine(2503)-C(2))-methyltransferase RlmN [Bacteroidetes bacterium]|nr:23S rRNA (adenine(2503)-C(2))-methyltransferase RlmN [Bacteroidota bacterium]
MTTENKKYQLKGLTVSELREYFETIGESKFRGEQLFNWMYNHLSTDFLEMQNLPKALREKLNEGCSLKTLDLITVQDSVLSGTKKYLFRTEDEKNIESVVIPEKDRSTLCISTQVGCPLDCKFCATGLMGYKRNLTVGEIVDQYFMAAKENGKKSITNIVYMGMGEPLLNFNNTLKSLQIFTTELNTAISRNRITVSTSGIPNKIKELADSEIRVKLALSLHSCFENIRTLIMPINKKYSLAENIEAIKYYVKKTKTRITFEYTMLQGINDREEDVKALAKLCKQLPAKINVIPFNSIAHMAPDGISGELAPTSRNKIYDFVEKLRNNNITVMIRETQGDDIAGACGQLAVKY